MSQRVPSWELEESNDSTRIPFLGRQHANHTPPGELMLDYEVTELTWVNGQLVMHGMGRPTEKPISKEAWEKPQASGTLESIVDQATGLPPKKPGTAADDLVPWFDHHRAAAAANVAMDALVPCGSHADDHPAAAASEPSARVEVSTRVGSCSGRKRARAGCGGAREESSRNQSESRPVTIDTCELDPSSAETSSFGKPLSSQSKPTTTSADDHDSDSLTRSQGRGREAVKKRSRGRSSISTKRSRAAAIHNQSERKRRDKINQRMKTLQKLVPNASKTDKASMLDEVIEYLKQLQYQIQMLSKMSSIPNMMMPMPMQNLQMAMMAQMGMGMNMPMNMPMGVMDMNNIAGMTPMLHPFLPMSNPWDAGATDHRLTTPAPLVLPEHYLAFLACQSQPMNLDAYSRMAAMYQQLQQTMAPTNSKN